MNPTDAASLTTTPAESSVDESLRASLSALGGLVSGSLGLHELLTSVATFAVTAIPGAEGAGVALLRTDQPGNPIEALAASDPFVAEIDRLQYEVLDEGPCITAVMERRTVRSGSLGGEKIWPRFGPRVGRLGIHSALSLVMMLPEGSREGKETVGAINLYSRTKDAFDEHAAHLGELFAAPAAVSVYNAQVLRAAQSLAGQLQEALTSRPVIDQAIGVLRARSGMSEVEAITRLRTISQQEHAKLVDVAEHLVQEAANRARARRSER